MELLKINEVASLSGIDPQFLEPYGYYKAKINPEILLKKKKEDGKLILVTAITPTKAGEGKTTSSIALAEGFGKIGQKCILCLREPALGPVFGVKGGATGGGKASIGPSEDINMHFTGDMHALTSSINLISAVIDNHIYQGNELNIDPSRIVWKRAMDMNDRALREIEVGLGDGNGTERKDGFVITVASEMMAIMCLAKDPDDFCARLEKIIVAYDHDGKPITVKDLKVTHAVMRLMKEALKPNLVQTLEHQPAIVHGGPFANIAHGCNSLIATKMGLKLAPIVITEAGFGADLGAEKFMDIVVREGNLHPDLVIMVATIRALKMHGGIKFDELGKENLDALQEGLKNLETHLENMKKFGMPVLVAINHFASDTVQETALLKDWCVKHHYEVAFLNGFGLGGAGSVELAEKAKFMLNNYESDYHPIYDLSWPLRKKIETICKEIYRAGEVVFEEKALSQLSEYEKMGYGNAYICMAKTPNSLTDNPKVYGAPKGHTITIRECNLSAGANFVVVLTGKIVTMPGLPKNPIAIKMEDEKW